MTMAKTELSPENFALQMQFQLAYVTPGTRVKINKGEAKGLDGIIQFALPSAKGVVFGVKVLDKAYKSYGITLWYEDFEVINN